MDTERQDLIRRYLLGDLSEADSAQLEDSSFSHAEQLEELRSVENDLIDEYARGELSGKERAEFEKLFFANPVRRQRVGFAMALARVFSHHGASPANASGVGTRTFRSSVGALFRVPRPALIYATAVLAVTVLIASWWMFTRTNLRSPQIVKRQPSGSEEVTQNQGPPSPSPETTERNQPNETRAGSPQPARDEGSPPNDRKAGRGIFHARATVATFLLLPGLSRSDGERTKLVIPPGSKLMRLKLELEKHDARSYGSFAGELSRASSERTWASGTLSIQRNRTVLLNIPVSSLPSETSDYDLTLRGRTAGVGAFETIGYYYLTIIRE